MLNQDLLRTYIVHLARVVQRAGDTIHRINHYPVDKCSQNILCYPLDSSLSHGKHYPPFEHLGPVQSNLY